MNKDTSNSGMPRSQKSGLDTSQAEKLTHETASTDVQNKPVIFEEWHEQSGMHEKTGNTRSMDGYPKPTSGEQLPSMDSNSETFDQNRMNPMKSGSLNQTGSPAGLSQGDNSMERDKMGSKQAGFPETGKGQPMASKNAKSQQGSMYVRSANEWQGMEHHDNAVADNQHDNVPEWEQNKDMSKAKKSPKNTP